MSPTENVLPSIDKCTIVIDDALPSGLAMNAAAVLSLSLGHAYGTALLGDDIKDGDGQLHRGITAVPLPVLKADAVRLHEIVATAATDPEVYLVDFTATAQAARDYVGYAAAMAGMGSAEHTYVGIALAGPKKAVNRLTGSLPLYR